MTRIIAGTLGGRRLSTPRSDATRPTTDRVREAVFSRIESLLDLAGARVLDLYAGSGALGLEALSRGAGEVLLVESDRRTARLIQANIADLGVSGSARVRAESVDRVLDSGPDGPPFDLVLLDPPYPLSEDEVTGNLQRLVQHGWLAPEALVLVERSTRSPQPTLPPGLSALKGRRYGETAVHYAEPVTKAP
jgi:16S rRNA (guanine966-N2)-methyltransferase